MRMNIGTMRIVALAWVLTILSPDLLQPFWGAGSAMGTSTNANAYTQVVVDGDLPYSIPDGGQTTINAPTTFSHTGNNVPGFSNFAEVHGDGYASFLTLKARVELSGPAARSGSTFASFNEVHTPGGGTPGTPDEMTLYFSVSGNAQIDVTRLDILPGISQYALAILSVAQYVFGEPFGTTIAYEVIDLSAYTPLAGLYSYVTAFPQSLIPVTVPIVYGESFCLIATLRAFAAADNDLISVSSNPYFETWGGGVIEHVVVDYSSTAELVAIVNTNNPAMVLVGKSGTDYTPLVTGSTSLISPAISSITTSNTTLTLDWPAISNQTYRVQHKAANTDTNWTDLAGDVTSTAWTASKSAPVVEDAQLYRLTTVP